jgi:hypothetical protein
MTLELFFKGVQTLTYMVFAGIGTWWTYRQYKQNRDGATEWIGRFLEAIYISDRFKKVHNALYYDYESKCKVLLKDRSNSGQGGITDSDRELLNELDAFLNVVEVAVYLEQRELINKEDRLLLFDFWFKYFLREDRKELRGYIDKFGYERISNILDGKGIE